MSKQRFNGMSFALDLGVSAVTVQKCTLDITDNTKVAKRDGRPDGYLQGDVEASGTMTVDAEGLKAFTTLAKSAGSWQGVEPFDICFYAKVGTDEVKVEAFGCKIKVNKLMDIDKSSSDETVYDLPFDVTDADFVSINGVPYLAKIQK